MTNLAAAQFDEVENFCTDSLILKIVAENCATTIGEAYKHLKTKAGGSESL